MLLGSEYYLIKTISIVEALITFLQSHLPDFMLNEMLSCAYIVWDIIWDGNIIKSRLLVSLRF